MNFLKPSFRFYVISVWMILSFSGMSLASQSEDRTSPRSTAREELDQAIAAVAEAGCKRALWVPAEQALKNAQVAFARGDYLEAIELAQVAQRFAELGIKQLNSAPYQQF